MSRDIPPAPQLREPRHERNRAEIEDDSESKSFWDYGVLSTTEIIFYLIFFVGLATLVNVF